MEKEIENCGLIGESNIQSLRTTQKVEKTKEKKVAKNDPIKFCRIGEYTSSY